MFIRRKKHLTLSFLKYITHGAQVSIDIEIVIPLIRKFKINGWKKHKIKRDC